MVKSIIKYPNQMFDLESARRSEDGKETFYKSFGKCLREMFLINKISSS